MPPKIAQLAGLGAFAACAGLGALFVFVAYLSRHTPTGGMPWDLAWVTWISLGVLMFTALFGYLARLGLITLAVFLVKDTGWVEMIPLGAALIITHLGLLWWETRYVSASLAFPALKPQRKGA